MSDGLRLRSAGHWMAGWWRGFQQPTLAFEIDVAALPPEAIRRAEAGLRMLLGTTDQTGEPTARHLVHHVLLATQHLQRSAGWALAPQLHLAASAASTAASTAGSTVRAALPVAALTTTREALGHVIEATNRLLDGASPQSLAPTLQAWHERLRRQSSSGQNTPLLLEAALDLDLPLDRLSLQVVRLGFGARQRLFASTLTDRTPALATVLARNKLATARLLRRVGLPGAQNESVADEEAAVRLARDWGYPVVVKPNDLDGGVGVAADLRDEGALRAAFAEARRHSSRVLLERHVEGVGHRLTVAHGRVIKATAKTPWGVTGDGTRSVAELAVAEAAASRSPVTGPLDDEALGLLRQHGLSVESVLPAGQFLPLRRRNNAAAGGRTTPLALSALHPHNHELALRAAEALLLDTAGVDLIVPDIGRSWTEQPAVICEVNAQPQIDRRTLAAWLAEAVGPQGVRIPVWLMLIGGEQVPEGGAVAGWAQRVGAAAWASPQGAWIDGVPMTGVAGDAWKAAQAVLLSPRVESALLVLPLDTVLQRGLPADRVQGCWLAPDAAAMSALLEASNPGPGPALHVALGSDEASVALLREGITPHLRRL